MPFGYLLLPQPPAWTLPVPDFREGFEGAPTPSANLVAVLGQSQRRQEWYRDYALALGAEPLDFVGSAETLDPIEAATGVRSALDFEVSTRRGTWADTRKALLRSFEAIGGLTVATSMVENNTRRPLDENEFRGFALVDDLAPLVFVNTHQTLNGQIFTLAHEFAHIWRGASGIGNEDPRADGQSEIERWCNAVASEVLVPRADLASRHTRVASAPLTEALDALAHDFRCGTLVVLQALHRTGVRRIDNYANAYDAEVARLRRLSAGEGGGGDHYNNQPFRIGERLSRADRRCTRRAHHHRRGHAADVREIPQHVRRVRAPPRSGLMHLLDANAFMEANRLYYGFDIAPGFWTWLGDPSLVGQVASIDAVKDEITAGTGDLVA